MFSAPIRGRDRFLAEESQPTKVSLQPAGLRVGHLVGGTMTERRGDAPKQLELRFGTPKCTLWKLGTGEGWSRRRAIQLAARGVRR